MAYVAQQQPNGFPEEVERRYRCCCNSMKVTDGAVAIGWVEIVLCTLSVIGAIVNYTIQYEDPTIFAVSLVFTLIQIAIAALLIYGVKTNRESLVLPSLIFQGIAIAATIVGCIFGILLLAGVGTVELGDVGVSGFILVGALMLVLFAVILAFVIWFFMVFLRCYQYIRARNHWLALNPTAQFVGSMPTNVVVGQAYQMPYTIAEQKNYN